MNLKNCWLHRMKEARHQIVCVAWFHCAVEQAKIISSACLWISGWDLVEEDRRKVAAWRLKNWSHRLKVIECYPNLRILLHARLPTDSCQRVSPWWSFINFILHGRRLVLGEGTRPSSQSQYMFEFKDLWTTEPISLQEGHCIWCWH